MKIHPVTIIAGYRMAGDCARTAMLERVKNKKECSGPMVYAEKLRSGLKKISMTTLDSKIISHEKKHFANLAVEVVTTLKMITYCALGD
nr:T-complex protein 1 subunit beta [Tanacetum cinerariifolium]